MMRLNVAAAMIVNAAGEVYCVRRGESRFASTAHKWEFPGGKIEPGETPAQAAEREVREELGIQVCARADGPTVEHVYPEFAITLHGILCTLEAGSPELREHEKAVWLAPDALWQLDFAAADRALVAWLKERAFGAKLRTARFGRAVHMIEECASTNDVLLALAEAGAGEGELVVAERQTAGRGRLGRSWQSEPGQGLLFSLLARPRLPAETAATLPLVAGVAMAQALRAQGFTNAGLKWPNDILLNERKVCGILCEAQTSAKGIEGIVVGVGVNVGHAPEELAHRAVGLAGAVDRLELLAHFCEVFEGAYDRWTTGGLGALRGELDALDCKRGKTITVKPGREVLTGVARGIRDDGALLLETPEGVVPLLCGEIAQWDA